MKKFLSPLHADLSLFHYDVYAQSERPRSAMAPRSQQETNKLVEDGAKRVADLKKELTGLRESKVKEKERSLELEKQFLEKDDEICTANQERDEAQAERERLKREKVDAGRASGELMRSLERDHKEKRAEAVWDALRGPTFKNHVGVASGSKVNEGFTLAMAQAQHLDAFKIGFNPLSKLKVEKTAPLEDVPNSEEDEDAELRKDEFYDIFKELEDKIDQEKPVGASGE